MISITEFVMKFLKEIFAKFSIAVAIVLFFVGTSSFLSNAKRIEETVRMSLESILQQSISELNIANLNPRVTTFCRSFKSGFEVEVAATIRKDGRLVAECAAEQDRLRRQDHFSIKLLDGTSADIAFSFGLLTLIFHSFAPVFFTILYMFVIYLLGASTVEKSLRRAMKSVGCLASALRDLRPDQRNLANTIELEGNFLEVQEVVRAVNLLLAEASKLHAKDKYRVSIESQNKIAIQVSHDIRSPLSALEMISSQLLELPEDKRLIVRNAIGRIRDIANSLTAKHRAQALSITNSNCIEDTPALNLCRTENVLIAPLLDMLVTEKRLEYRELLGVFIEFNQSSESYGLFAKVDIIDFKRILSNLINNSVEALAESVGKVRVYLNQNEHNLIISVQDNGMGIPAEIIPKLGRRGGTFNKVGGSGLGLANAKEVLEIWGGTIVIRSKVLCETLVTVTLPKQIAPEWFVPKLKIQPNSVVVVFDDDQSIHQIWKGRLESVNAAAFGVKVEHISNNYQFRKFYRENFIDLNEVIFLMDYELLGQLESGLDLIEQLGIQGNAILVTSRYEESEIRNRCERIGVKLIPKPMSGFIPIEVSR